VAKLTIFTYDSLNRRTFVGFGHSVSGDESTINYSYDAGNRLTQGIDSATGSISRSYDGFDNLTQEITPQGSVNYVYDGASRRTSMTVSNQSAVSYTYDTANRLVQIAQGTATVAFAYDMANRRTSLTLPNGVTMSYGYDSASQVSGIDYKIGSTTLGNLAYNYDLLGRRAGVGGSYMAAELPQPISVTGYDAANELKQWGTMSLNYDLNGNLVSDGSNSYSWDARNHLVSMNSGITTFQYDPWPVVRQNSGRL
jgi:YD repeat-containing protein